MASRISFWLSKGSDRFHFPVNPEEFTISDSSGAEDFDVVGLGEVTMMGNPKLKEVSFSSFFPRDYDSTFCEYRNIPRPYDAGKKLMDWLDSKEPLQFTITGTNVSLPVTVRSFDMTERGGEVGDIYFEISLKEYKAPKVRIYDPTKKPNPTRPVPGIAKKHKVVKNDNLWNLAQKYYGNSALWKKIYDANKKVIGSNPHRIYIGQILTIPAK